MTQTEKPIAKPTWLREVRTFFTPEDIDHMGQRGIDLATYDGVKANALRILGATEPPDATMPPDMSRKWSQSRWETFKNWIIAGFPFGTPAPQPLGLSAIELATSATRVRRNAASLTPEEIERLQSAFTGLMQLPPDDTNSYFALAGIHWLPAHPQLYCLHHENRYNPWHRTYLSAFEDALRTVPGCEDITLPYWDITARIPDFLYAPPFDAYVLPRGIGSGFDAGYTTTRYSAADVEANVASFNIPRQIAEALNKSVWSQFNARIIQAHDNGHVATGDTLGQQDVAAYDPIFWFFHSNLDRLWWKWQQALSATTLNGFLSTVTGSTDWLKTTPFNSIPPFPETADQTIELTPDIDYEHPVAEPQPSFETAGAGSLPAAALLGLEPSRRASIRVKGIDRLTIPGSFAVLLKAGEETVARQAFFQARNPRACSACVKQGKVNIDLEADMDSLGSGLPLRVEIQPLWPGAIGSTFPLSSAGDPTVNVRLLLR